MGVLMRSRGTLVRAAGVPAGVQARRRSH